MKKSKKSKLHGFDITLNENSQNCSEKIENVENGKDAETELDDFEKEIDSKIEMCVERLIERSMKNMTIVINGKVIQD